MARKGNKAKARPSAAQLRVRQAFARMARAGRFRKGSTLSPSRAKRVSKRRTTVARKTRTRRGGGGRRFLGGMKRNELMAGGLVGLVGPETARIHPVAPAATEILVGAYMGSDAAQYIGARTLAQQLRAGALGGAGDFGGNGGAVG